MKRRLAWLLGPLMLLILPELYLFHRRLMSGESPRRGRYEHATSNLVRTGVDGGGGVQIPGIATHGGTIERKGEESASTSSLNSREGIFTETQRPRILQNITSNKTTDVDTFRVVSSSLGQTAPRTRRYLFPVQFWEGGPNWNYLSFRRLVAYALAHNRTIVTIPFHNHFIEGWSRGWRTFGESIDAAKLGELVALATPETYKAECGNGVDLLVQFPLSKMREPMKRFHRGQYERTRADFKNLWDIELPDTRSNRRNKTEVAGQLKAADDARCLAIHGPLQIEDLMIENETEVLKSVDGYFLRAEYVREMGDRVRSKICGGKPYIAIHWRNRTGEVCEFHLMLNGVERCSGDLVTLANASRSAAGAVGRFMEGRGIDCVYVAAPPRRQEFVDCLRDEVPHVFTASDVTSMKDKRVRRLKKDNYKLSLVEQEVCEGAEVFLSCGRSNWSDFVRIGRELAGKDVSYLRDLPGVPVEMYRLI